MCTYLEPGIVSKCKKQQTRPELRSLSTEQRSEIANEVLPKRKFLSHSRP